VRCSAPERCPLILQESHKFVPGQILSQKGASSWSADYKIAQEFSLGEKSTIFEMNGTTRGTALGNNAVPEQKEVLLSSTSRQQVLRTYEKNGITHVVLQEVSNG
jgi:hypothetical protein